MKITNADIIKTGERELIDTIIGDLDWNTIEKIVKERHKLKIQDDIEYRQGDIVVHDNQVAYKLDFDVKMTLSVMFDRDGNYLSLLTSDDSDDVNSSETLAPHSVSDDETSDEKIDDEPVGDVSDEPAPDRIPAVNPEKEPKENFSKMASHIAEMISEINED